MSCYQVQTDDDSEEGETDDPDPEATHRSFDAFLNASTPDIYIVFLAPVASTLAIAIIVTHLFEWRVSGVQVAQQVAGMSMYMLFLLLPWQKGENRADEDDDGEDTALGAFLLRYALLALCALQVCVLIFCSDWQSIRICSKIAYWLCLIWPWVKLICFLSVNHVKAIDLAKWLALPHHKLTCADLSGMLVTMTRTQANKKT
jgi:hypothetical protein